MAVRNCVIMSALSLAITMQRLSPIISLTTTVLSTTPRLPIHVDLQARFLKATNTKCSSIFIILNSPNSLI